MASSNRSNPSVRPCNSSIHPSGNITVKRAIYDHVTMSTLAQGTPKGSANSFFLLLQLLLQLGEKAPVSALGNELLRATLDHPHLVEAEGVEAHGILRVILAPLAVGEILH